MPGRSTLQVAIPVLFIGLLVWIKSICTEIDAPSVAYTCGQTDGFDGYYTDSLRDYARNLSDVPLLQCLRPPDGWCVAYGIGRVEFFGGGRYVWWWRPIHGFEIHPTTTSPRNRH